MKVLEEIANGNVLHMIDSHRFMADSLFCEWAYIIDLDNMRLLVYKGFQKTIYPLNILPPDIGFGEKERDYFPVKMLHAYSLNKLPCNFGKISRITTLEKLEELIAKARQRNSKKSYKAPL